MTPNQNFVPMGDLYAQYLSIKTEIDRAIDRTIRTSSFVRGEDVDTFEDHFATAHSSKYCVSCGNGTDAIYIAMKALGVGPGDEVIVPAMSWISTSETVSQIGAKVVFCDIDPVTYTLDPKKLPECITNATVGIIPVHLYGHPADMDPILQLAKANGLWVIEDAAQAHLATYKGRCVGSIGDVATFSFYPGKNLGAFGDAGAILTDNEKLHTYMKKFARHGGLVKGQHDIEGINSRLDGIQAAILTKKLVHLNSWTEKRKKIAEFYLHSLSGIGELTLPSIADWASHVWHLFVIQISDRDRFIEYMSINGIQTSVNYPVALPFLPCYRKLGHTKAEFPEAYRLSQQCVSIPLYPELSQVQIDYVVDKIVSFLDQ